MERGCSSAHTVTIQFFDAQKADRYKATFSVQAKLADGKWTPQVPGQVEVHVGQPPKIDVSSKAVSFAVARCGASCPLGRLLAPEIDKRSAIVQVTNQSPYPIEVKPSLQPQGSGPIDWMSQVSFSPPAAQQVEPLQSAFFAVQVASSASGAATDWSAGKYEGKLVVAARQVGVPRVYSVQGSEATLVNEATRELGFVARVRDSVWFAVVVAFLGVLLGRILQSVSSDVYQRRIALMVRLNVLVRRLGELACDDLLKPVRDQIDSLVARIDYGAVDELAAEIKKLEEELDACGALCDILGKLRAFPDKPADMDAEIAKIEHVIDKVVTKHDTLAVQQTYADARAYLARLNSTRPESAMIAAAALAAASASPAGSEASPRFAAFARLLAITAGTDTPPVGAVVIWLQPLLAILLVVLLTIYGVWLVYSGDTESAQTFGA